MHYHFETSNLHQQLIYKFQWSWHDLLLLMVWSHQSHHPTYSTWGGIWEPKLSAVVSQLKSLQPSQSAVHHHPRQRAWNAIFWPSRTDDAMSILFSCSNLQKLTTRKGGWGIKFDQLWCHKRFSYLLNIYAYRFHISFNAAINLSIPKLDCFFHNFFP